MYWKAPTHDGACKPITVIECCGARLEMLVLIVAFKNSAHYHGGRRSGPAYPYTQAASAPPISIGIAWHATGTGCCPVTAESPGLFLESVPPLGHWSFSRPLSVPDSEDFASWRLVLLSMYSGSAISGVSKHFSIIRQHCSIVRQHFLEHKFRRLRLHKFAGSVLASEY